MLKATRQQQPYRSSQSRAPSQVLDRMTAGKAPGAPGAGKVLMAAKQRSRGKQKRMLPRY